MKNNWKDFFEENKNQIQAESKLSTGHENRFLSKLNKQNQNPKSKVNLWKYAAVLIPAMMLSLYFVFEFQADNNPQNEVQTIELTDFSPELGEANNYFAYVIREKVEEVKSLKTPETTQMIDQALVQLDELEIQSDQLLIDLKESGGNPQVIKSIMMNLQLQIQVLETVLAQIEHKQELKQTSYENIY